MNESKPMFVDISKIDSNPYQTRLAYYHESMEELKQSIKQLGIVTPLVVRPIGDRYQLVSGSRRLKAAQELGLKEVPVIVKELSDQEVMEITITENLQRENLNAIEEALGFKRLLEEFNYTHEKLAERLGKSRSYITNSLRLLKLNWIVQVDVLCKTIMPWHARCLLSLPDQTQFHFSNLIMNWIWNVEETRDNVKRFLNGEDYLVWTREIPVEAVTEERLTHQEEKELIEELSESIKTQGLIDPIIVDVVGNLYDGHARLKACKRLGWKLIPADIIFRCNWLKSKRTPTQEPSKGNPILDKLEEMKLEPWCSHTEEIRKSLRKENAILQNTEGKWRS
jgi:ParB family chromosome partitioning protein